MPAAVGTNEESCDFGKPDYQSPRQTGQIMAKVARHGATGAIRLHDSGVTAVRGRHIPKEK